AGGRRFDKVKEEATAEGGRRGTFVEMPAARAAARTLAVGMIEDSRRRPTKNPACAGFFVSPGMARRYFFLGRYRSVMVPS
ncbi:hypothetical protein, partial [Stenotrophomonas indicatrix]|uniref:hypothetical protein n=1 Tax=Stenotrophomonas indicatrix TaxID=2045451 RepID=UPI001AA1D4A7